MLTIYIVSEIIISYSIVIIITSDIHLPAYLHNYIAQQYHTSY